MTQFVKKSAPSHFTAPWKIAHAGQTAHVRSYIQNYNINIFWKNLKFFKMIVRVKIMSAICLRRLQLSIRHRWLRHRWLRLKWLRHLFSKQRSLRRQCLLHVIRQWLRWLLQSCQLLLRRHRPIRQSWLFTIIHRRKITICYIQMEVKIWKGRKIPKIFRLNNRFAIDEIINLFYFGKKRT